MPLPIFKSDNQTLMLMQTQWAHQINRVLASSLADGQLLQNVVLQTGDNVINHKLGHKLTGWVLTRVRAGRTFYDKQDTNSTPDLTLILNSSGAVTVDLWVF